MFTTLIAAAAVIQAMTGRPGDLAPGGMQANVYPLQLQGAALGFAALKNGGACPPGATVTSLGYTRLGSARDVMGARPDDPVDPKAGVYKEHVRIDGCGAQSRRDNFLAIANKNGGWVLLPLIPGDSRTTPVQQHDALTSASQIVQVAEPKPVCADGQPPYRLVDTFVTDTTLLKKGMWSERWVQQACGVDRTVNVHFMPRPDGKATSIVVEQAWPKAP